ncbi:MAG TPA: hypothetical protein VFL04_05855 [Rectinemataceae bacterium]|nr:hypothetical protein [Rectinemataceae bacterium]
MDGDMVRRRGPAGAARGLLVSLGLALSFCVAAAQDAPPQALPEMDALLAKAREAIDSNHLAEGIRSYVGVIALFEASAPGQTAGTDEAAAARAKAEAAASELARIGARLSIEPASEWLDATGSQVAAATGRVGKADGLSPGLYLYENFGSGKSPVPDAPIHFEFTKNGGSIVPLVSTDAYGKANTTIASLDEPGKEAVVRAYPVFSSRGKTYAFRSVFRDFSFLPAAKTARVLAFASSELGQGGDALTVDSLVSALEPSGLRLSPYNGAMEMEGFRKALAGDGPTLASISSDAASPYVALALVEVGEIRQVELNGRKYNIFSATARAGFRIVRSDGHAVWALPIEGIRAQGGSRESAVADGYRKAREALMAELRKRADEIRDALAKD